MNSLLIRAAEFFFYKRLLTEVAEASKPTLATEPEMLRLYRELIALKAQLDALSTWNTILQGKNKKLRALLKKAKSKNGTVEEPEAKETSARDKPPLFLRAAQVFAYLLTRGHWDFQRYSLSETLGTLKRWATRFSVGDEPDGKAQGGRPELAAEIACLIVTLKKENPIWGQRRIKQELKRMGIKVSEPTIKKVLFLNGFPPHPGRQSSFEIARAAVKDALWAMDFFAVRTAQGKLLQVLLIADIYTRELVELRVHDGWDVSALWTICAFNAVVRREHRAPKGVVHDHGLHFRGQFEREMRVQEIEEKLTPAQMPWTNCFAERPIYSVRRELLNHLVVRDAEHLQALLDDYRAYANRDRAHQGLEGRTPLEVGQAQPEAQVIDLAQLRGQKLQRRSYAHGLLNGYELVPADASPAGPPAEPQAKAA